MTELVQRSTDFVRSALLEHLRFESHVEASALTQQPRGQQWRVIRVSGDMLCGFLEFGEGNDGRRSNLGRHGGSLWVMVACRALLCFTRCNAESSVPAPRQTGAPGSGLRSIPPRSPELYRCRRSSLRCWASPGAPEAARSRCFSGSPLADRR